MLASRGSLWAEPALLGWAGLLWEQQLREGTQNTSETCPSSRATSAGVTAGDKAERTEKILLLLLLDILPRARQQRVLLWSLQPHQPLLPWELQIHSPGQLRAAGREKKLCQATGKVQLFC